MLRLNKIFSLVFVTLHLCTVLVAESGHTDEIFGGPHSIQTLTSHDCGAKERHKDLKDITACQACYRSANSAARFSSTPYIERSVSFSTLFVRLIPSPRPSAYFYRVTSKRGPPPLFS